MGHPFPVVDGHVDLVYAMQRSGTGDTFASLTSGPVTPQTLGQGGVRLLVGALYCADAHNGPVTAAAHLIQLMSFADRRLTGLSKIRTTAHLQACLSAGSPPGVLPLLENGDALADGGLDTYAAWGLRIVGLTHAGANRLADGNAVAQPAGLRPAGRRLVSQLAEHGWAIDVAHLAEPGFWQLLDCFPGPLLCSHTGLRFFHASPRNLSAQQIAALLGRGGILGLAFAPEMLNPARPVTCEDVFRQLDWLVQRHGDGGIALGSDLGGFDGVCSGLETHAQLGALSERLRQTGYPEASVARIMGGNWLRFYRMFLPADA